MMRNVLTALCLGAILHAAPTLRAEDDDVDLPKILNEIADLRKTVEKEAQVRIDEAKATRASLEEAIAEALRLRELIGDFKGKLAVAETELQACKKQNQLLEKLIAEREKKDAAVVVAEPRVERPEREVRGRITSIANAGLYVVSVGGDDGVQQGDLLEVFRSGETPRLIGNITVMRSYAKQAIGQFKPSGKERADVGDEVASRGYPK